MRTSSLHSDWDLRDNPPFAPALTPLHLPCVYSLPCSLAHLHQVCVGQLSYVSRRTFKFCNRSRHLGLYPYHHVNCITSDLYIDIYVHTLCNTTTGGCLHITDTWKSLREGCLFGAPRRSYLTKGYTSSPLVWISAVHVLTPWSMEPIWA